ncbi:MULTISPECIES: protein rhiA [unclassified Rhizobium]|uniref:protein rhiA n=1 Tax=unclassified Rhizobium TaxID=2613769 RepID=UPI003D29FF79
MTTYSLTCINDSQLSGSFAVFQKAPPTTTPGNVFSLAWFARPTAPNSRVTFTWGLDYSFIWSETGVLRPGINFSASQVVPADPNGLNLIQLKKDQYGATTFAGPTSGGSLGSLTVKQLSNVQPNATSVGIGMAGSGTFVVQAQPNMTAVFTPHPNYWVIFGNFETGDVIDIEDVTTAVEVTYGGAQTSRTAVLNLENMIAVS